MNIQKHFKTLELDKILNMLSNECGCSDAADLAISIQPSTVLDEAITLIKQTEDAYILMARFGSPSFSGIKNIHNQLSRASAGGMLNMGELLIIAGVLRSIRMLIEWRSRSAGLKTVLDDIFERLYGNKYLEEKIFNSILSEEEMSDNASQELATIRRKMVAASNRVREKLDSMIKSPTHQKYLQDSIVTIRGGRFVLPVKSECRGNVEGLVHDTSSSGATVFIEPMAVVEANNELKVLKAKEEAEIERILYELSSETGNFAEGIRDSCECMVMLDLIFAKAKLAYKMKASVPALNDKGYVNLKRARHPLLDPEKVVPVDITLGGDFDTLVITGPNTGGKTVTIKAIGLITLMAMCGLLIPAMDKSELSVFKRVMADIGDEQSIEQSLSTFSSHIKNIIDIMANADNSSLVLLDELCAGTDPVEGAALATSILESVREKGAKIAATTHYAELKAYALDTSGVENACCEFDVATLAPTYKLLIGVPGRSNAFAISERLGINREVVDNARSMISAESSRFERVVEGLERSRKSLEEERFEAKKMLESAKKATDEAEKKLNELKMLYNKELEKARNEARAITDNARAEVNRVLDELDKIKKTSSSDNIAKAKAAAKASFKKLDKAATQGEDFKENYTLPRPLALGDTVLLSDINKNATVLSLPDEQGNVMVQAGIMKIKAKLESIRLIEEKDINTPKFNKYRNVKGVESRAAREVMVELDLRGQNAEEGIMELDRFIDNTIMSGIGQFSVIHGKGTGVLRAAVHSFLKKHKAIKSYRLGVFGEGESGVTIVELK